MKTLQSPRNARCAALVAVALFGVVFLSSSTAAADGSATAEMGAEGTVVTPLNLTVERALNFGIVSAPQAGTADGTVTIPAASVASASVTGAGVYHFGGEDSGHFTIGGENERYVQFSAAVTTNFADPDLSIDETSLTYSEADSTPIQLGETDMDVYVGAGFIIGSATESGLHTDAVITIDVVYVDDPA